MPTVKRITIQHVKSLDIVETLQYLLNHTTIQICSYCLIWDMQLHFLLESEDCKCHDKNDMVAMISTLPH
jgi:hypothetical protein